MPLGPQHSRRLDASASAIGTNSADTINIAVFDDNALFRAGIAHVLNAEPGLRIVAASDVPALDGLSVDVAIIDAALMAGHRNLAQSIHGFRWSTKVLVLALSLDEEQVFAAFAAGARGYVLKGISGPELLAAVRAVHRGEGYVSPSIGALLVSRASLAKRGKPAAGSALSQLTSREAQILDLLTSGLTNREIGCRLAVTEKTVKRYLTGVFEKLNVRNRVEAVMLARQRADVVAPQQTTQIISNAAVVIPPLLPVANRTFLGPAADDRAPANALLRSNGANGHSANGHSPAPGQAGMSGTGQGFKA